MARRILLLITDLQIGGTPSVVRELAIRLREPGRVGIEVACLSPWGPVADQLQAAGVKVTALNAASIAAFPLTLLRLIRLIRHGRIDTVFSFLIHANALAAAASIVLRRVRFLQSIQTTQPRPHWHWALQRLVRFAAERIVVPSGAVGRAAQRRSGVPAGQIYVIPNAIDLNALSAIQRPRREADAPLRVGFLGRLDPIKRVPELVSAMTLLTNAELHIYGDGPERQVIQTAINTFRSRPSEPLTNPVTLHGAVASPEIALQAIDVLVLPSAAEGFGLVLIEAMAAGVPVVGTNIPGIREVIRDGVTGILCQGYAGSIARAIREATEPGRREALIAQARQDVAQRFSWPGVLEQYRRLLR